MRLRLLLPLLLLAGCRVPGGRHVTEPDVVVPETWSAGRGAEVSEAPWWNQFGDEHLTAMVEEALVHNYDLRASVARIEAAAAQARIAGASLSPTVGLGGRAGRNQQVFVGLPIPGGGGPLSSRSTSYGVSIDVSWEADLWGRLRSARHAAVQDLVASTEDHHAALLSLAAQTSKGWFAWQQALLQEALAESTAASFAHTAELVRRRYENGRDSMLDVHRAEADWASARARRGAAHRRGARRPAARDPARAPPRRGIGACALPARSARPSRGRRAE